MKRVILVGLKLAVVAGIYAWLFQKLDWERLLPQFANTSPAWLALSLLLALLMYFMASLRWRKVVGAMGEPLGIWSSLRFFLIGVFCSQFLFATIGGDAVRIWLAKRHAMTLRTAFNSTFFDRLAGLATISLFMLLSLPVYFRLIPNPQARLSLSVVIAFVLAGMILLFCLDKLPLSFLPFLKKSFGALSKDARAVFLAPKWGVKILGLSLCVLALTCLVAWSLGQALGEDLPVTSFLVIIPPVLLITVLPISLGGWGVREGVMVVAFGFLGVRPEAAFALSVWFGVVLLLASLPGGLLWLSLKKGEKNENEIYRPSYSHD